MLVAGSRNLEMLYFGVYATLKRGVQSNPCKRMAA